MSDREVMQMALETLDNMAKVDWREWDEFASVEDFVRWAKSRASFTAEALRTALAQPESEPEPVAFVDPIWMQRPDLVMAHQLEIGKLFSRTQFRNYVPLYTAPPKREWVGLTHTELEDCILISEWATWIEVGRAIEQSLKEKNNG